MGLRGLCRPLEEKQGFLELRKGPKVFGSPAKSVCFFLGNWPASHRPSSAQFPGICQPGGPDPVEGYLLFLKANETLGQAPMQMVSVGFKGLGFRGVGAQRLRGIGVWGFRACGV